MILLFSEFLDFLKYFFINISMNPLKTQTNFLYTQALAIGLLNVPTALCHMLMPSAQHWAVNECCGCIPPCPDYKTPISGDCFDLRVQDVGICLVYLAIYDLEI